MIKTVEYLTNKNNSDWQITN